VNGQKQKLYIDAASSFCVKELYFFLHYMAALGSMKRDIHVEDKVLRMSHPRGGARRSGDPRLISGFFVSCKGVVT